jgi:dephospho-CoA kinase
MQRPWRIGLTGGIGSGKSTFAGHLRDLGAAVIDTDAISRALTQAGGEGIAPIRAAFGGAFIDDEGALNRPLMRAHIFAHPGAKAQLEAILHPLIQAQAQRQAQAASQRVIVFDIPLLVESGHWLKQLDRIWVIDCEEQTQVQRVMQRSGWSAEAVAAVMAGQASRAQRRACADAVISNEGITPDQLRQHAHRLLSALLHSPGSDDGNS